MARSSRHKSSKHSSRDTRGDYSDSERKGKEEIGNSSGSGRHVKESEKQMLDSKPVEVVKDSNVSTNIEFNDDDGGPYSSSKKRKEKIDVDRWAGGDVNEFESSKGDSRRSSRKDENSKLGFDGEDGKRGGRSSRVESKHRSSRSVRRERGEKEKEKEKEKERDGGNERKSSSKSEKYVDIVMVDSDNNVDDGNKKQGNFGDERGGKHGVVITDSKMQDDLRNSEPERDVDRRVRRKRDGSGDGDRHQNGLQEPDDRRLSLRYDKSERLKDDCHKGEKSRDKYQDNVDRDHSHQDEKQSDIWPSSRDVTSGNSDDKQVRNENKFIDVPQKKSKLHRCEYDRDRERDHRERTRDRDRDRDWARERDHDRIRVRDRDCEHERDLDDRSNEPDRDRDRDLERSHDRDRGRDRNRRDRDRVRDRDHIHGRGRDREYDNEHDYGSHVDDKVARYKEERGRSPDGCDEYQGDKQERSLSRKPTHVESVTSDSRSRNSPSSRSYVSSDKYRDGVLQDEMKYGDPLRDGAVVDKVPKYRSGEKRAKFEDNHIAELPERSPSTKPSPGRLNERSPSTTSVERRYNRSGRRSTGSISNDTRDVPLKECIQTRDFPTKEPLAEDYPPTESLLYPKPSQGNVPSGFRAGGDGPSFIGSFGDENRGRYRRNSDPNMGRGPNNAWKGVPNWPSQLPNGFMPFPPGPPPLHHGGFPPMMSQFPPPQFNVRPSFEMNPSGIPFHMVDADRFSSHVRPAIGWPNMVDGSVPPHFHGWDANNGAVRDEPCMFISQGNVSSRGRDMNPEMWKPNGDMNMDDTSGLAKASTDEEASCAHGGASKLQHENSCVGDEGASVKKNTTSSGLSSAKDVSITPSKVTSERTPESFSTEDTAVYPRSYLAKLDISMDLSDPELYNQCIKDQPEYFVEDMEDASYVEEKSIEPEIISWNRSLTYFPPAKDSIFQRAMNLYKNLSSQRSNPTSKGTKLINPLADASLPSDMQVDPDENAKQADPSLVLSQEVPTTTDDGGEERDDPEPVTCLLNAEVALIVVDDGETLVQNTLAVSEGVVEENICAELILKDAVDSNADVETTAVNVDGSYLDVKVSDEVVVCNESVKVCEAVAIFPVSNESEVILSRIHHAPESTH